jgi:hypothetical protein
MEPRTISNALIDNRPNSLNQVIKSLKYCGVNPYRIVPEPVFSEIASTGLADVTENRLVVTDMQRLLLLALTGRTHKFIEKLDEENKDTKR